MIVNYKRNKKKYLLYFIFVILLTIFLSIIISEEFNNKFDVNNENKFIDSIVIEKSYYSLKKDQKEKINYKIEDDSLSVIKWESDNDSIAIIDENGYITAKGSGKVNIKAYLSNEMVKEYSIYINIEETNNNPDKNVINDNSISSVKFLKKEINLEIGKTYNLNYKITPSNAKINNIYWKSSSNDIVSVNNGNITAKKEGKATITLTIDGKSATCNVNVNKISASKILLNSHDATINVGSSYTLTASVSPSNTTYNKITWSSSDENIASVDNNGKVTGLKKGSAVITAQVDGKKATCNIMVKSASSPIISVSSVSITNSIILSIGSSSVLKSVVLPSNATNKGISWNSSNTNVVTVDSTGKITAKGIGTAKITATADGKSATCNVTVSKISVSTITLNKTSINTTIGSTTSLTASISPSNATYKSVSWKSSNTNVVTVDSTGKITAKGVGTAKITATADGKSATCNVTVSKIPVSTITLNKTSINTTIGSTTSLTASISPSNATYKSVSWKSSNTNVVTVDSTGKITAKGIGTAKITATADGKSATCNVTVSKIPVSTITLNKTSINTTIGSTTSLTASISPSNATYKNVSWKSSNTNVVTVDSTGKITAKGIGTAKITATADGKSATCNVTVSKIPVSTITLNKTSINTTIGSTTSLTASISPSNATYKSVSWNSSNTNVVTVDSTGKITAKGIGTAKITATADGKSATCNVTVSKIPVQSINLSTSSGTMRSGFKKNITATISPSNATYKTISWSSSNSNIVSINANGSIVAKQPGTATITASADGVKNSITITVKSLRVLMVGNSKTYIYDLAPKFKEMSAAKGYSVELTYFKDTGGKTIQEIYNMHKNVFSKGFDIVIFQEQTTNYTNCSSNYNNGITNIINEIIKYSNSLNRVYVRKVWVKETSSVENITAGYNCTQKIVNNLQKKYPNYTVGFINDGPAMYYSNSSSNPKKVHTFLSKGEIYEGKTQEGNHQNQHGALLSAACIYATVYNEDPTKNSYTAGLSKASQVKEFAKQYCYTNKTKIYSNTAF